MGKQHLGETGWATLVRKHKVKDLGLQKLLVEYSKWEGSTDFDKQEDALDKIEAAAKKVVAENGSNKEVKEYLKGITDEVGNAKKTVALLQKSQAKKKEDEGEDDPELPDLKAALNKVKSGTEMQFIACIGKPWALALAKKVGSKHKEELTKATGGSKKFIIGTCIWELEKHTFVVGSPAGGMAKNLMAAIKAQAKLATKVRIRGKEGGGEFDSDTDQDPEEQRLAGASTAEKTEGEVRDLTETKAAERLKKLFDGMPARLNHAKSQAPDEGVRQLANIKAEFTRENTAFNKAFPGSKLKPEGAEKIQKDIEDASDNLEKKAVATVNEHCKEWLSLFTKKIEDGGLNTKIQGTRTLQEAKEMAEKLLHHINEIEEGVHLDSAMMKRMGIKTLDAVLKKVSDMCAIPRKNLDDLMPKRTTKGAPAKAPDVNRPAPKGVTDPEGWTKACDDVDLAIAKGTPPKAEDTAKMLEGAEQALNADTRWKWEPDLKDSTKWGGDWNKVKAEYKRLLKSDAAKGKEFMSGYWWFRKLVVDKEMAKLATKYGFEWESVGSTNLESDYDISVKSHGTKDGSPRDWQIVELFNKAVSSRFSGVQPGTLFDTNLYASAPPPELKSYEEKTQTEKDMDAMSEAGQDVGALMKMRRYMSWEDYTEFQDDTLAELQKALQAEKDPQKKKNIARRYQIAKHQFEEADSLYFTSLETILKTAKITIPPKASAETVDGQKMLIEMVEELEKNPDKLMAATNEAYVERMKQVRVLEGDIKKLEGKDDESSRNQRAALLAKLKTFQTDAVFFAAEAYHSEGPYKHIVQANQKSAQEVKAAGKSGDEGKEMTAKLVKEKLDKLPLTGFMQSFNEQLGDFLKDLKHYEHKSPFPGLGFYRSSKYLERLCDSMVWIAEKLKGSPAHGEFVAIKIAGKDPKTVQGALGSLVAVRGGKVEFTGAENTEVEAEAYSMDQAQAIFGSSVKTLRDLGTLVKDVGKKVNAVLRKAQAGQAMTSESENAYFASGSNAQ